MQTPEVTLLAKNTDENQRLRRDMEVRGGHKVRFHEKDYEKPIACFAGQRFEGEEDIRIQFLGESVEFS